MTIKGDLRDMSIHDLIQFFRMGSKSGILGLVNGTESGMIYVAHGRIVDAINVRAADSSVLATGTEAAIQIFLWNEAKFAFRNDAAVCDHPVRITHDEEWLEQEAQHRAALLARISPFVSLTLDSDLELVARPSRDDGSVLLDVYQWRIISLIPSLHTLRAICARLDLETDTALQAMKGLVELGLVKVMPTAAQTGTLTRSVQAAYAATLAA
jgi:hypothetical protein